VAPQDKQASISYVDPLEQLVNSEKVGLVLAPIDVRVRRHSPSLPFRLPVPHGSEKILTSKNLCGIAQVIAAIKGSV